MLVNSTSYSDSCLHLQPSLDNFFLSFELNCVISAPGCFIFTTFTFVNILLLLPPCIFVLYHGLQQWQKQRVSMTATATHADIFTCHLVVMELILVFGYILCCFGIYTKNSWLVMVWFYLCSVTFYGETFFQLLTCVEHYLAVVRPVTYLRLRGERWVPVRNGTIGCIWLLCLGWTGLMPMGKYYLIADLCLLTVSVITICFCSLSVLLVLIRPGAGKRGRERVRVDQSKRRAFYTIVAILGVLLLRCSWSLAGAVQAVVFQLITECVSNLVVVWLNLPGSLVLPLLFVQRTGAVACCKNNTR